MARLMTTPRMAYSAGVAALVVLVCIGWLLDKTAAASTWAFLTDTDTLMVVVAAAATVAAVASARTTVGRVRAAWLSLAVGLAAFTVGSSIWFYYQVAGRPAPFPSVADAAYLILPVSVCVTLLLLAPGLTRSSRTRLILDAVMVASSLTIVVWALLLGEIWAAAAQDRITIAVTMTYAILDAAVLTIAILVTASAQPGQRRTFALLTAAMVCISIADGVFVYLSAKNIPGNDTFDIGWLAGLLLLMAGAVVGQRFVYRETVVVQHLSSASVWLPFVPVVAASLAGILERPEEVRTAPIMVPSVLVAAAFLIRQLLLVSENRRLLAAAAEQALRDPLTGVGNRTVFRDHLAHAMQMRERDTVSVGVLVMDLDDFKVVNDTLGHPFGDQLLSRVAERILGSVRAGDTVARLGGDEFAVLIEGRDDNSQLIAHRVVAAFDRPFVIDDHELLIRPSVGLAVADVDDVELTADELLKRADVAMYSAKRSRTGDVHMFRSDMLLAEAVDSDLFRQTARPRRGGDDEPIRLLGELRRAIDRSELVLVYQPKFDLNTLAVVGVEALVRWPHPDRGLLEPNDFLPLVRRYGLMGSVNKLVVNRALDDTRQWRSASLQVPVAVNIFAPSMTDLELPGMIATALADRKLRAADLTVEITEDLFLDDMQRAKTVLRQLQTLGIRVSIDDFGSGYSALSYMRELTVDEVKLDRQFVAPILTDTRAAAVARAVLNLADELGLTTVAEGIEDAETADWLREHGCHVGQGYFFSLPLSGAELLALLTQRRAAGRSEVGSVQSP